MDDGYYFAYYQGSKQVISKCPSLINNKVLFNRFVNIFELCQLKFQQLKNLKSSNLKKKKNKKIAK